MSCTPRRSTYLIRDAFSPNGVPQKPDYKNEKYWAALPDRKDAADTTPGKQFNDNQANALVDVFFIHPTTFTGEPEEGTYKWNASVDDEKLNTRTDNSTILYQASVFNGACKVYAPRYRQAHVSVFFTKDTMTYYRPLSVAYGDVKDAFAFYLKHYNNNRPFLLASHSQGTIHARRLLHDVIEKDSALYNRFVAGYLVGYAILPDSLSTKPCATPEMTRCYCTWNTFAKGYYPPWYTDGLNRGEATNPLTWTTDTVYASYELNNGGVLQDFRKVVPNIVDAQVHHGMVWVNKPRVRGSRLVNIRNYHIGDYNLFYVNIRDNVQQRIDAYIENEKRKVKNEK